MMKKIVQFVSRYMSVIIVAVTVFAYFAHGSFTSWIGNPQVLGGFINVNHLLMVVMCGMGLTMTLEDFKVVLSRPKDIFFGECAQFIIMPLTGYALCLLFHLPIELAIGVILVGCCPGGTASNVMTFMAKGDVVLSIGMTCVSTILAPFLTPLLCSFYVGLYASSMHVGTISVDLMAMFISIIEIVMIPLAIGLFINRFIPSLSKRLVDLLPLISCTAICLILGLVIDANHALLFAHGFMIIAVVILHNGCGYLFGYLAGRLARLQPAKQSALIIEVGMQNSGMATSLAASCFPDLALATVPGALFSAWHNISGALIAKMLAGRNQ